MRERARDRKIEARENREWEQGCEKKNKENKARQRHGEKKYTERKKKMMRDSVVRFEMVK